MQFQRNSSTGKVNSIARILLKTVAIFVLLFLGIILVDKIEFPYPHKNIEKEISNGKFKVVK